MRVWITLDRVDGSQSRTTKEPVWLDEVDLRGMLFRLNEQDVVGVTFTRADVFEKLRRMK